MLDRCLYIFKHSEFLSEQPFEIEDGLIEKFLYACEVANFNEKKRITYFEDKMSEIDYRYEMDSERAECRAEGRAEVAKAMLTKGMGKHPKKYILTKSLLRLSAKKVTLDAVH